jgi:hypothetical protein
MSTLSSEGIGCLGTLVHLIVPLSFTGTIVLTPCSSVCLFPDIVVSDAGLIFHCYFREAYAVIALLGTLPCLAFQHYYSTPSCLHMLSRRLLDMPTIPALHIIVIEVFEGLPGVVNKPYFCT